MIKIIKRLRLKNLGKSKYSKNEILVENIRKVLIVRNGMIGDAIVLTPFIRQLKKGVLNIEIDIICNKYNIAVFNKNKHINNIFTIDELEKLNKKEYDITFSLVDGLDKKELKILKKINTKNIYGFSLTEKCGLTEKNLEMFTKSIKAPSGILISKKYLYLLKLMDIEPNFKDLFYELSILKKVKLENFLKGINNKKIIGINSKASSLVKTLSENVLKNLLKELENNFKEYNILILSIPDDREYFETILRKLNLKQTFVSLKTETIIDVIYLISKINLLISVDTSTIHIAAAFNIPTIGYYYKEHNGYITWTSTSEKHFEILFDNNKNEKIKFVDINKTIMKSKEFLL